MARLSAFLCFALFFVFTRSQDTPRVENYFSLFNVNGIVDRVINKLTTSMIHKGYEPLTMPSFEASFLHVGFLGKFELHESHLYNLSTMYRSEDVAYQRVDKATQLNATVHFQPIKMNSTYKIGLLGLGKTGLAVARLPNLTAEVELKVNLRKRQVDLNRLKLTHQGNIDVHLEGGIVDKLASILTETTSNLFKEKILRKVERTVEKRLNNILQKENKSKSLVEYWKQKKGNSGY